MNVMLLVSSERQEKAREAKGVMGVDIITGTLGKALGGAMDIPLLKKSY
jgi:hypothetical protein